MSPYSSEPYRAARFQWSVRDFLQVAATFRRSEQPETYKHVHPHGHATAKLSRTFAAALARGRIADRRALDEIELGAYLHDIGKYLIPASVLLKPGPLSPEERASVSLHPAYGADIISGLAGVMEEMVGRELDPDLTQDFVRLLVPKRYGRR